VCIYNAETIRKSVALSAVVSRILSSIFTGPALRDIRRAKYAAKRRLSGSEPTIHYFHQVDDPYSYLAAQMLARLAQRYRVRTEPHLVPPPDDTAVPDRKRLADYALRDAARLARRHSLDFPVNAASPSAARCASALAGLAAGLNSGRFAEVAVRTGWALWSGAALPTAPRAKPDDVSRALAAGETLRRELGHYLGAMFYFEGEWYWGVDRLHHLEARLAALGLDKTPGAEPLAPWQREAAHADVVAQGAVIDFWFSFRSPYSYIAFARIAKVARESGARLRLRYILPMVMRGLPVPRAKRLYIMLDCKREANLLGVPFGKTVDPVGVGVERALAVLHHAVPLGLGEAFAEAALRAAFAQGVDLASEAGLLKVSRSAGLTDAQVSAALTDQSWRATAEENRQALLEAGLWGAPTFRVAGLPAHWGQDRIWALQEDIAPLARSAGAGA
jgi:2-hydroxychromene-2-carboxylate isomerase